MRALLQQQAVWRCIMAEAEEAACVNERHECARCAVVGKQACEACERQPPEERRRCGRRQVRRGEVIANAT